MQIKGTLRSLAIHFRSGRQQAKTAKPDPTQAPLARATGRRCSSCRHAFPNLPAPRIRVSNARPSRISIGVRSTLTLSAAPPSHPRGEVAQAARPTARRPYASQDPAAKAPHLVRLLRIDLAPGLGWVKQWLP
jgi:hypothetical protein